MATEAAAKPEQKPHTIDYTVDGEDQSTTEHTLTPNQILTNAGRDTATYYLVEIVGKNKVSYEGKPAEEIKMHEKMKFVSVLAGETGVS
jgi:hypothetical protein